MRLALTAITILGATTAAHAAKPTIGVEWEITGGIAVTSMRSAPAAPGKLLSRISPISIAPQMICLARKTSAPAKVPVELPLVTITYDMGETDHTLEIVTGPIGSDVTGADAPAWTTVFHFVEAFFDAVKGSCTVYRSNFNVQVKKDEPAQVVEQKICFATVKDITAKMAETMKARGLDAGQDPTLAVKTGVDCGAKPMMWSSDAPKRIGVWLSTDKNDQPIDPFGLPFDSTNTQINIATPLALWGTDLSSTLATLDPWNENNPGAVGAGGALARLASERAFKLLAGVKDPAVKGYFVLYTLALNAETQAIANKWEGVDQKNAFVVYLKSSLGLAYDLLVQQGKTPELESLGLTLDQLCFLTIPCAVADWNKTILAKGDPIRPFARKPIKPYLDDQNAPTVVVETRWGNSALARAAKPAADATSLGFADPDELIKQLAAFR